MEKHNINPKYEQENFYDEYAHRLEEEVFERNSYRGDVVATAEAYAKNGFGTY